MAKHKEGRSVLYSWIISNGLILAIPLIVSMLVYAGSLSVYKTELDDSNADTLRQLRQSLDSYLGEVQKLSVQLEVNGPLGEILNASGLGDITKTYAAISRVLELNRDLNNYAFSNSFVKGIMVSFRKADLVWFEYSVYDRKNFIRQRFTSNSLPPEKWEETFLGIYNREYRVLPYADMEGRLRSNVALIHSIPVMAAEPPANIVIYIDETKFMQAAEAAKRWDSATIKIVDAQGRSVYSTSPTSDDFPAETIQGFTGGQGFKNMKIDGRPVVVSYIKSRVNDWVYLLVVPDSVYTQKFVFLRNLVLIGIAICLILGAFSIFFLANRNYLPLRRVLDIVDPPKNSPRRVENEYQLIRQSLDRLRSQDEAVRANFILNLMKGRTPDLVLVHEKAENLGIKFSDDGYLVVVAYFDTDSPFFTTKETQEIKDWTEFYRIIGDSVRRAFGSGFQVWQTEYAEMSVFLINLVQPRAEWKQEARRVLLEVRNGFEKKLLKISFAVSDLYFALSELPRAFQEAIDTMEYRILNEENKPLFYSDIPGKPDRISGYSYTFDNEKMISNLICSGESDAVWRYVQEMIDQLTEKKVDIKLARCLLYDLIGTVMKTVVVSGLETDETDQALIHRLMSFQSIPDIKTGLRAFLERIGARIQDRRRTRSGNLLVQRLTNEIMNRYSDPNLSVSDCQ